MQTYGLALRKRGTVRSFNIEVGENMACRLQDGLTIVTVDAGCCHWVLW